MCKEMIPAEITTINTRPGDLIIIKTPDRMPGETRKQITEGCWNAKALNGCSIILLENGATLEHYRGEQVPEIIESLQEGEATGDNEFLTEINKD